MGNGGFPSTHTSTVSATAFLIALGEGWLSPAFGLAITFLFIVVIDATGLRIAVGKQAGVLNTLIQHDKDHEQLRERMGHTLLEIIGGVAVGFLTALALYYSFSWLGLM